MMMPPAAVHIRELHRQELLDTAARERLVRTAMTGTTPRMPVDGRPGSVAASVRSEIIAHIALVSRFARIAATMGRPQHRVLPWS